MSKVGATSSPTPEGNNAGGVVNSTLHPSYTKVTVVTKEGKMHELPDFHLPITARLSDARQALKSSLPSGVQVYFLMPSKEAVSLLLERSTTVGEVMQGGTIMIRDVTGMPNTNRQFCVCGSVADYECSRCEGQGYCSEACQRKSWPTHMRTCIPLPRRPQPVSTQQVGRTQATPIRPLVFISNHQNLDSSSESEVDDTDVAKLSMRATGGSTGLGVGTKNNTTAATTAAASNTTTGTGTGTGIGIGATTQSFTSIANLPKPVQASPPPILPVVGMHPSRGGSLSPNIRKPNLADMRMNPSHTHTFADSDDEEEKDNRVHNDS